MSSSRREFIKKSVLLTATGFLAACQKTGSSPFAGFEICQNTCIGCGDCLVACEEEGAAIDWEQDYYKIRGKCKADHCSRPCVSACKENAITIVSNKAVIDLVTCTRCGDCIETCPYDAINPAHVKMDPALCNHCGKCFSLCTHDAISKITPAAYQEPHIDQALCTKCGDCTAACLNYGTAGPESFFFNCIDFFECVFCSYFNPLRNAGMLC